MSEGVVTMALRPTVSAMSMHRQSRLPACRRRPRPTICWYRVELRVGLWPH